MCIDRGRVAGEFVLVLTLSADPSAPPTPLLYMQVPPPQAGAQLAPASGEFPSRTVPLRVIRIRFLVNDPVTSSA
jgi:hypothetical protein